MKVSIAILAGFLNFAIAAPALSDPSDISLRDFVERDGNVSILAAGTLQAFDDASCTKNGGAKVTFSSGRCLSNSNRHSFKIQGCTTQVIAYSKSDCSGEAYVYSAKAPGSCTNVNTGHDWKSSHVQCN